MTTSVDHKKQPFPSMTIPPSSLLLHPFWWRHPHPTKWPCPVCKRDAQCSASLQRQPSDLDRPPANTLKEAGVAFSPPSSDFPRGNYPRFCISRCLHRHDCCGSPRLILSLSLSPRLSLFGPRLRSPTSLSWFICIPIIHSPICFSHLKSTTSPSIPLAPRGFMVSSHA